MTRTATHATTNTVPPRIVAERRSRVARIIRILTRLIPDAGKGTILRHSNNWELLVAVRLSAQCTDKKVNEVTQALFKKYRTLDDYVHASKNQRTVREFEQDIRPTGFYHSKAKDILAAAKVVKERFRSRLPKTMAEMVTIPGVGRKSANVILGNAYGIVEGIAVDTHVRRLARCFGLTDHNDPVKIERDLMAIVPKKYWFIFTYLLVEYGRRYCPSRPHRHESCPLTELTNRK